MGHDNLVGEVIRIDADKATIQVYEETGRIYAALCATPGLMKFLVQLALPLETQSRGLASRCRWNWVLV